MEHAITAAQEHVETKPVIADQTGRKHSNDSHDKPKPKSSRRKTTDYDDDPSKRRCVSSACVACRKRKSKCDGNTPACAACSQVYGTECIYDPNSDHRRKGVYKSEAGGGLKMRESTLQTLVQALLNYEEADALELVREMRSCESLDAVAERVLADEDDSPGQEGFDVVRMNGVAGTPTLEKQLYGKMGDLRLDDGSVRYIGGTSNLIHITQDEDGEEADQYVQQEDPITSWTTVTDDPELVVHLLTMYFTWHYTYFTTLSKSLFYRDFMLGQPPSSVKRKTYYCSPLLVNTMLALGCHFTSHRGARADPDDSATAGDHFFKEAKRLILENDEHEKPRLTTVQALALMSVREAGCGREAKGWVYSGMSFRMGLDMGLNLNTGRLTNNKHVNGNEAEEDVRRITFWGCYLFDKCWSNYLGRLPQIPTSIITAPKPEVFPDEDSANWSPYTDSGFTHAHAQPARTRAVALQTTKLCEISNDLMKNFYDPSDIEKGRSKATELKMLSDIHRRLETWRSELPKELEPREGGLSSVLTMHMFFQLLYVHLFRPFLQYTKETSPLPDTVSPRKLCTAAASMISKLMRLYKRSHGLRQICNICVYIVHSACTIHLLNLPEKGAKRDIVHGVKHLEEIAEGWLCARRSLGMVSVLARKWKVELPDDAVAVLARTDRKFGPYTGDAPSPGTLQQQPEVVNPSQMAAQQSWRSAANMPTNQSLAGSFQGSRAPAGLQQAFPVQYPTSETFQQAPYDISGLPSQPFPAAQHFHSSSADATPPQASQSTGYQSVRSMASPSEMFGGVEQLLNDSNEWAYRDQAQFATGFENWTGMDVSPGIWQNGGSGGGGTMASGGPVVNANGNTQANGYRPSASGPSNGYPAAMEQFNGLSGGFMNGYNEDEWYQ